MRRFCVRAAGWACLLLGVVSSSHAREPLSLTPERVVQLVEARALTTRQARLAIEAGVGAERSARTPQHNPELSLQAGPREGAPHPDVEAAFSWTLQPPGERAALATAAAQELDARRSDLTFVQQEAMRTALTAYYQALHARNARTLAQEQVARDQALREHTRIRVERGDVSPLTLQLADAALLSSQAEATLASASLERQTQSLLLLLGENPLTPVTLAADFPALTMPPALPDPKPSILQRADVQALKQRVEAAEAQVQAQKRAALPSVTLQASYAREEDKNVVLAGVSVPLPIFQASKGPLLQAQAEAQLSQTRLDLHLQSLEYEYRALTAEANAASHAAELLFQAQKLHEDALTRMLQAVEAGNQSLMDVLPLRREALLASRQALDARLNAALTRVALQAFLPTQTGDKP